MKYMQEKNKTYGLTTLRKKHLNIDNGILSITFKGKRGIPHTILLKDISDPAKRTLNKLKNSIKTKTIIYLDTHHKGVVIIMH